jgi:cobaltochelatase CobS
VMPVYIEHSGYTSEGGCGDCGETNLIWAHELLPGAKPSPADDDYCGHCSQRPRQEGPVSGALKVVDPATMTPHVCRRPDAGPFPGDDDPVTHGELNQFGPVSRQQLTVAIERLAADCDDQIAGLRSETARQQHGPVMLTVRDTSKRTRREIKGLAHFQLPTVIMTLDAGEPCLMAGAAGCGKEKIARQAAEVLGVEFYSLAGSLTPQTPVSSIMGYMNSAGDYVGTNFRTAFQHGGLIFLDEIDNAHPESLAAVNQVLAVDAGEKAGFADGMIPRHQDFYCAAAANTFGLGGDLTYARHRGDAATWDRFSVESMEYDLALEGALCLATGLDAGWCAEVTRFVRELRRRSQEFGLPHVFGMRASRGMCRLLAKMDEGMTVEMAVERRCRRGKSADDWDKLAHGVPLPGARSRPHAVSAARSA